MVVGEANIHNIMGGMESTGGVPLHNHKRKLKQRFDIIKKLGQGTYGKVQLGINKETGQEVAIKTIKKCKIDTEADLIRIRREIQIMSSVQHPNIIHIYEVFENREKMVLVMEYAAGGELYDYLSKRKVLSEQEARRIFRQIATAVYYCHKHKICHRDLKLENILLDQVGNAKIADFGLSNVFDGRRLLSTFCGSPLYASPEIVKGTPYHGPEVDCWSLGVLLYTLVYGAMPFDGSNFKRLAKQISQSDYFEPKKPSPASPLIKEMLTVCPSKRADIERICTHWWVNEGYEQNCLDIAEDLAVQTPVRLDLLLSLVPQSASAEKLLVGDQQVDEDIANSRSSETLVPTRCHSIGSLMELDTNSSDRRISELFEEEPRSSATSDAKRKLETTPSMDETAAANVKRKERRESRRKDKPDEREPRTYRSLSRHYSAPIPNSISEEAMEIEPTGSVSVPISKTVIDLDKVEATAACLELIKESKEKSPNNERSEVPIVNECVESRKPISTDNLQQIDEDNQKLNEEEEKSKQKYIKSSNKSLNEDGSNISESADKITNTAVSNKKTNVFDTKVPNENNARNEAENTEQTEVAEKDFKKLKERALSFDSETSNEATSALAKPVERRRSKIFETAEKFNQLASTTESEKPKKIFIPGVNVGGAKRAFERKASLSSVTTPPITKATASKVIIDVPTDKKSEKDEKQLENQEAITTENKLDKKDEAKKRAVDIITGAIGKPPMQRKLNGSPPQNSDSKTLGLKIQVGPNDVRSATVSVSTPIETKFAMDDFKSAAAAEATITTTSDISGTEKSQLEEPKMSSKMEITLKSATLPRRKTTKAEITLSGVKPVAFKSEVEAKIDAFQPQKLRTQRSEVAFPVEAAMPHTTRSASLEPEGRVKAAPPRERIIPIQVETGVENFQHFSTPPFKPPMSQRSMSQRSGSLSRQSTGDSDTDSAVGSTIGPEPIRKSPREYIIPIAVEGGGYVTPRSGSLEPESQTSTPTSTNPPRSRFGRPRRMSSLLSDASEDESPFSPLHSEDILQRHMHRLRSSRPSRQPPEHADSLSSGEDDDDDGFELLTAENLFSTLLSRVRSLTQRLNVDDNRSTGFPSSRLFGRLGSNSPQSFWGINKPLSRRLSESQFKHSLSRDSDIFSRRDPISNPGTPNSPGSRSTPSRESIFEIGSNTLPRDKLEQEEVEAETAQIRKEAQETLQQGLTPNLARRLSRHFIEQTRQSIPRSPSTSRDRYYLSPSRETLDLISPHEITKRYSDQISDRTEYRGRSAERGIRRTNSLLEPSKIDRFERHSPRRSISLFDDDDDDKLLPPLPRHVMTLGRKYKESGKPNANNARRENFYNYKTDKIQEESGDDSCLLSKEDTNNVDNNNIENGSISESISMCNSNTNLIDTVSSVSAKSCETSPTESSSNLGDYSKSNCKADISKNFETRLLAAENLIKESKLKNLMPQRFNPNLSCNYKDTDKCDKEALITISEPTNSIISKRRSCIPSLRLRSGSLTREPSVSGVDRRKSFADSQDNTLTGTSQERSLLSKFFRGNSNSSKEVEAKDNKSQKPKQHRISRFLRPDFFDTPREESQYVKEKEAQKAAENERRKSRFMKRKSESKERNNEDKEDKSCKDQKNEINALQKDKLDNSSDERSKNEDKERIKIERQGSKTSFLHSLEKKLEKFRSNDETLKPIMNGGISNDRKESQLRENSAPPNCFPTESGLTKRTLSVEDLALDNKDVKSVSKGKMTSVLSLFKTADTKQNANGSRSQNRIMSKLKKSPPKCAKAESCLEEDIPSTSKIPTKFGRIDNKSTKKIMENKKSPERIKNEHKRSPTKEKLKEKELISKEKKPLTEKQLKESKKVMQSESLTSSSTDPGKTKLDKMELMRKLSDESESLQKVVDNKHMDSIANNEGKKVIKTKKNTNSLSRNEPVTKIDKVEDFDKKMKKPIKSKESIDKEEVNGTKKKKIIRVVKKVVKKSSESSDSKSEEKSLKPTVTKKKITTIINKEKSPENSNVTAQYLTKRNSPDNQIAIKSHCHSKQMDVDSLPQETSSTRLSHSTQNTNVPVIDLLESSERVAHNSPSSTLQNTSNIQAKSLDAHRPSRAGLKLDFSKIPQHTFRHTTPKKDSPKSGSPKANSIESPKADVSINEDGSDKLIERLSKMTHHANITGNKIIIDKPLRAKDVAELKREVTECARIIENHIDLHNNHSTMQISDKTVNSGDQVEDKKLQEIILDLPKQSNDIDSIKSTKEPPEDCTNEFSPEEPESFDSWSICSADLNHNRSELHSPTSPSYSLFMRNDNSESVIDRIRRRSFYQRFNDRKRSLLTVPPPGVTSATLPRRFSFNSSRDRERSRLYNYNSPKISRGDKSYGLHGEENSCRKSPVDKERHIDNLSTSSYEHYSPEAKSTFDYYSRLPSSSHDSLRRYTRSPTLDLASARAKYHSTDIITENDLIGSYKSPLLRSSFNDGYIDSYYGRNTATLPRKYGSTVRSLEPKSVEYYEEILSPSNPDYLSSRETCKSPLLDGYLKRCENGYHHNSNLDLSQFSADKQRSYMDKMSDVEFIEGNSRSFDEQRRNNVTP